MKEYQVRYCDTLISVDIADTALTVEMKKNNLDKQKHVIPKASLSSELGTSEEKDKGYIHNIRVVFKFGMILSVLAIPSGLLMDEGISWSACVALAVCFLAHVFTPVLCPTREAITLYSTSGDPQFKIPSKLNIKGKEEFTSFVSELDDWLKANQVEPGGSINSEAAAST